MRTRHSGFGRVASLIGVAVMACGLVAFGHPGFASDCACGAMGPDGYCPPPQLEQFGGWSLFWHDPCTTPGYCWAGDQYAHTAENGRVYGSVDFLPMFRDESGTTVYQARATRVVTEVKNSSGVVTDTIITYERDPVLTSGDLNGGFEPGVRALVGVSLSDWYRLECSYFRAYEWSDSAGAYYDASDKSGNLLSPFSNFGYSEGGQNLDPVPDGEFNPVHGLDFNNRATISWSSQLDNVELNLRRRLCMTTDRHMCAQTSCLVGLRYIKLNESLNYETESPAFADSNVPVYQNSEAVHVNNDLIGPQIGALAQFLVHNRAWIDVSIKGAILFDRAKSNVVANVYPGGDLARADLTAREDATAFLGDLSLEFNYQFAPAWTVRAGYNAMWLSGVALATRNFVSNANTFTNGGLGAVEHDGNVVFHGPNIGITWVR